MSERNCNRCEGFFLEVSEEEEGEDQGFRGGEKKQKTHHLARETNP